MHRPIFYNYIMKILIASTLIILVAVTLILTNTWSFSDEAPGKTIFIDNKCSSCHSVKSQGIIKSSTEETKEKAPPDLSNVGTKHTGDWMCNYLLKKETLNDAKHLKKFKGSQDDLEVMAKWLATLKTK